MGNTSPREGTAKAARAALGGARISVSELVRRTGRSRNYWEPRLDGTAPMTVEDLLAISDETGVAVTDLVRGAA